MLPCARSPLVNLLVRRVFLRHMMNAQHWSSVESSRLQERIQEHWRIGGASVKTDVEKSIK